ncbi:hypothetical protein GCM10009415_41930 [Chitinophaga japonensis]
MTMIPDVHKLHTDLDNNTVLFLDILDTMPADRLHMKNEQTAWSIMDCAEHMLIAEQQVASTLQGPAEPVKDRAPNSKVAQISQSFMDFDKRLFVLGEPPTLEGGYKDIATFSNAFRHNRECIKAILAKEPADWLCRGTEHASFGYMTRMEWVYYLIYHTERHLQQIHRIEASLENMQ